MNAAGFDTIATGAGAYPSPKCIITDVRLSILGFIVSRSLDIGGCSSLLLYIGGVSSRSRQTYAIGLV